MAYIKNVWVDQDVERPKTYEVTNNQDNTVTLTESFGVVTEIGTPVNAVNMNHIEEGIADNDTAITTINSKIPSNASSENKMVTQEDVAPKLHALKGYSDSGELLTDLEGFTDVKNYARSTFDLSKFTVVGSPNITADGIASGFGASDYIKIPNYIANKTNFKIKGKYTCGAINENILGLPDQDWATFFRAWEGYGFVFGSSTPSVNANIGDLTVGQTYYFIIEFKNSTSTLKISLDGVNYDTYEAPNATISNFVNTSSYITIGCMGSHPDVLPLVGSIDLKQFSITVDGVEVFSGNKTGIDTIKPDDYTVVGSPTISADGVASGLSDSNYLILANPNLGTSLHNASSWKVEQEFIYGGGSDWSVLFSCTNHRGIGCFFVPSEGNAIGYALSSDGVNEDIANSYPLRIGGLVLGNKYKSVLEFTGTQYIHKIYSSDGSQFGETKIVTSSTKVVASNNYYIGGRESLNSSIDLNALKIYVDGNLVYQPCLKIPYTESKTGSKIVNSVYRDRVSDMYEQFGSAPYYTLSDTDFTLPQGEIYGMKVDKVNLVEVPAIIETYVNGTSWYRIYSDGWCEQGGQAAFKTSVAFLKAFANTNYMVLTTNNSTSSSGGLGYPAGASEKTVNGFFLNTRDSGSDNMAWYACGYIEV